MLEETWHIRKVDGMRLWDVSIGAVLVHVLRCCDPRYGFSKLLSSMVVVDGGVVQARSVSEAEPGRQAW